MAVDNKIRRVGGIALLHQALAGIEANSLAHECQQLQLGRLNFGKDRHPPEQLEFLLEAHRIPPIILAPVVGLLIRRP